MGRDKIKTIVILQVILAVYSVCGILSKSAANVPFLGFQFCCYYAGMIVLLGAYAVLWQQIIKRLPLTVAFANKAITVVWGIVWGILLFNETITPLQVAGAGLIILGIVLYSTEVTEE